MTPKSQSEWGFSEIRAIRIFCIGKVLWGSCRDLTFKGMGFLCHCWLKSSSLWSKEFNGACA